MALARVSEGPWDSTSELVPAPASRRQDVQGNYDRARFLRDALLVNAAGLPEKPVYLVEYALDPENEDALDRKTELQNPELWEDPKYRDAKHLAGFDRVWAYTQGIALAQFSRHPEALGLENHEELGAWRDQLERGIFHLLWDDQDYRRDLEHTLQNPDLSPGHRAKLVDAAGQDTLGRFITGGTLAPGEAGPKRWVPSTHVAIDNCSWLSLSVDHAALAKKPVYRERLARCLEYTMLTFAKPLTFEGRT